MKNGTDAKAPAMLSLEKQASLGGFIAEIIIKGSPVEQVDYWLGHKKELVKNLNSVFSLIPEDEFSVEREDWQGFYKAQFNWDVDFSQVIIPPRPVFGDWRLIFIPKGMTINLAFDKGSQLFKAYKSHSDLNKAFSRNIRNTQNSYTIWVKDGVEPDAEFLGQSTKQADPDMELGITLLEGIIFEVKYFLETDSHLNIKGVTLCSGSRYSNGNIPFVRWLSDSRLGLSVCELDLPRSEFGIRLVMSN